MTTPPTGMTCPRCGTAAPEGADWRFCGSCGAPLAGATCVRCEAPLTPGAAFCHRCGMPAGGTPGVAPPVRADAQPANLVPWAVGGIALLALFALLAGRSFSRSGPDPASRGLAPTGMTVPMRAGDISQLSPEERADRLYNRVMMAAAAGRQDSVAFFAPMAIEAYQMLGMLNEDQHYDVGRIAAVAGALPLARAHADSILTRAPTHLLGLVLAAHVADLQGDVAARTTFDRRLLAAEAAELRRDLPEYGRHHEEIVAALAAARSRTP